MAYDAYQAAEDRRNQQFARDLEVVEGQIRGAARSNSTWVNVSVGSDPDRMRRVLRERSFNVEVTHGGIGTKVSF